LQVAPEEKTVHRSTSSSRANICWNFT